MTSECKCGCHALRERNKAVEERDKLKADLEQLRALVLEMAEAPLAIKADLWARVFKALELLPFAAPKSAGSKCYCTEAQTTCHHCLRNT